jgi:diguanylate cyclase (GGDEF)-like protein
MGLNQSSSDNAGSGGGEMVSRDSSLLEKSLLRTIVPLLGLAEASLFRVEAGQRLTGGVAYRPARTTPESFDELTDLSCLSGEMVNLTNSLLQAGIRCEVRHGDDLLVAYPLFKGKQVGACLVFLRGRPLSPGEDETLRTVLEVYANYHHLIDFSQRDRLTGLFNRDRMWTALSRPDFLSVQTNCRRTAVLAPNWLAAIGIDPLQDAAGQDLSATDDIVQGVSHVMATTFRSSDQLYRYGGDEFVAVISAESQMVALTVFERLRMEVEAHTFLGGARVTLSIGYCRADPHILPLEVLSRADRSLYQAKLDGRNLCYEYHALVKNGVFEVDPMG